jgi:hypothetical protein
MPQAALNKYLTVVFSNITNITYHHKSLMLYCNNNIIISLVVPSFNPSCKNLHVIVVITTILYYGQVSQRSLTTY